MGASILGHRVTLFGSSLNIDRRAVILSSITVYVVSIYWQVIHSNRFFELISDETPNYSGVSAQQGEKVLGQKASRGRTGWPVANFSAIHPVEGLFGSRRGQVKTKVPGSTKVPVVISEETAVIGPVLAAGAAVQVEPLVIAETNQIRQHWLGAPLVFVGVELAPKVASLGLKPRDRVFLLGSQADQILHWAAPLAAAGLLLPRQASYLGPLLAQSIQGESQSLVVGVTGGSGGLGASTLACGLALSAADLGLKTAVVELDEFGGGLDRLFGVENEPGWRWDDLKSASGFVDDLTGQFPNICGVDVVAGQESWPNPEAVQAILGSLLRSHEMVVLDSPLNQFWANRCLYLVGADARSVAAASKKARKCALSQGAVVVRCGPGRRLEPALVADLLGMPLLGTVGHDRWLPCGAEQGQPPGKGVRSKFARDVKAILQQLVALDDR